MSTSFTIPASQRKRKRTEDRPSKPEKRRNVRAEGGASRQSKRPSQSSRIENRDDSISGSESGVESLEAEPASESEATSAEDETAAERRARLAERYLDNIREEVDENGFDAEDINNDLVAKRLREEVDEIKGRQFRLIVQKLNFPAASYCLFRSDTEATTAVAIQAPYVYTVSKDRILINGS